MLCYVSCQTCRYNDFVRVAATRTLGVFLAVFAGGVLLHGVRVRSFDPESFFVAAMALLLAVLIACLGSLVLRRARALVPVVFVLCATLAAASAAYDPAMFAVDHAVQLTPRQNEALAYLMTTQLFEMPHIGFGGAHSGGYLAMRILQRAADRDTAFKELVRHGSAAGQLYGLIGVWRTDPLFFSANRSRCERRAESIGFLNGCMLEQAPIETIVADPHAVHLQSGMTLARWVSSRPPSGRELPLDVAGGGYSSLFLDPEPQGDAEADARLDEKLYDFVHRRPWDPHD